jgi:uncharacterized protein (TIGR02246 family)
MRLKIFAITIITLCAANGIFAQEKTKTSDANKDEAAIRQVVRQVQDGWNTHDGKAYAEPFAEDADYVIVNGLRAKGREEIEKGHIELFTGFYKDSRNIAAVQSIRFLRKDVAVVHVEWSLEFQKNGETKKVRAMNTMIMVKENGKWEIVAFQNTPIQSFDK